jgi:hypothetical protein
LMAARSSAGTNEHGIDEVIDWDGPLHGQKFRANGDTDASSGTILAITETRAIHKRDFVVMTRLVKIGVRRKVGTACVFCMPSFGAWTAVG